MKKWIAVFLSTAILLAVTGCGGSAGQPAEADHFHTVSDTPPVNNGIDDSTAPPPTEEAADQSSVPEDSSAPEQTQEPTAEPGNAPAPVDQQPSGQPETTLPPAAVPATAPE